MKKLAYSGDTKIIKNIVNAINYLLDNSGGSEVEVTQILSSGTKIAEISVDGDSTDLYAPESGSEVSVTQILSSGTKIAEIEVDGVRTDLYAPQGGGGGGSTMYSLRYFTKAQDFITREYVRVSDDGIFEYRGNTWSTTPGGSPVANITKNVQSDLTLYYATPSFIHLPATTGEMLCEAYAENFDATKLSWGNGTNPITFTALGATISNGVVTIPTRTSNSATIGYVDLERTKRPFTAYIVAKLSTAGMNDRILCAMAQRSGYQGILAYSRYGTIQIGRWNDDTGTGVSSQNWFVVAIQFTSVGNALGKANTASALTKASQDCGQYLTIGRSDIDPNTYNAEPTDVDVKYLGVVDEAESLATIEANITSLMTEFGIS